MPPEKPQQSKPGPQSPFMRWLDITGQGADWMMTHPFSDLANGISLFAGLVTGNGRATSDAAKRLVGWQINNPVASLKAWVTRQLNLVTQEIVQIQAYLLHYIYQTAQRLTKLFNQEIAIERARRIAGDRADERYTRQQVLALHQLIEREAAGAYRGGYAGRTDVISKLADYLASHDPVVRRLTGDLISGLLDLASIDDPVARLALGFVMKHIIGRLGVDKVAGDALSALVSPLLDHGRPHDLPGVIRDLSARLDALEGQQAQFWRDGGAEVEQAGAQWSAITSPLIDAALIGWLAQAVVAPQAWARELSGTVEPVMGAAQKAFTELVREG